MNASQPFLSESERVTRLLRDQLVDGVRAPGSKLVERDLAAELGVSRLPVRDALKTLVAEGLVTPRPRTWAVVREFTATDIADLIEVRSAFEVLAFRLAAQRATRAGLDELRHDLDAEWDAARAGDAVGARRAAADFHETVTRLAGNDLLGELERTLRSRMRWLLGRHDDLAAVAREHEQLYHAIANRDVARVEALAAAHIETSRAQAAQRTTAEALDRSATG
ncbi:GntR family transcriptional regulator [Nocardia cyriacigeorgica]|uniref:GntR family transcriptional regulator n=1 Tax=Nocardia cyriacigeorgica TaxID=135487 RepID=A0A6P1D8S4_9NOCA|nr:GntR family transcriptional regulator [Nocardia cyriacigeorgica]NEW37754.1 GntR family transcriptional regulator [Nocardia cyriacigeorgica]NEW45644.1 GntR family transcriptional regulator [Nocardia cyriacigeorgica]NEW48861.1 GntR family transcriptional regulator [Nocardia cyriacigeorgica]NEW56136.1 GntR family transcriptional regulator [Nocardia cyriacigeorgica]